MPAKSKAQQRFFGIVRSVQKGETPASEVSPEAKKAAKTMSKKSVKDYAKTKHKNLPEKKANESIRPIAESLEEFIIRRSKK